MSLDGVAADRLFTLVDFLLNRLDEVGPLPRPVRRASNEANECRRVRLSSSKHLTWNGGRFRHLAEDRFSLLCIANAVIRRIQWR